MKYLSLFLLLIILSVISNAQQPLIGKHSLIFPDENTSIDLKQTKNSGTNNNLRSAVEFIPIGTSYNLYSVLYTQQSQVSYSPEIHTIAFVHRQNDGTSGGSGGVAFDFSTDGGATWTINQILTPDYNDGITGMTGNRYPSGTLWNPPGNTNPNHAYFVTHGACLTYVTGGWGATLRASQQLNGANIQEEYYSENNLSNDYLTLAIQSYASGSLWDCKLNVDKDSVYINEATFNSDTHAFDFSSIVIAPDWYNTEVTSSDLKSNYMTVFNEEGIVGYTIIIGSLNSDSIHNLQPVIYKTIDAGITWSLLSWFDFSSLTDIQEWLIHSDSGEGPIKPYFNEFDATVDVDGRLNIFAAVSSGLSTNSFDSINYYYPNHEVMMHFTVSNGADWTAKEIGFSNLTNIVYGSIDLTYNPQISRNTDGDRIFMTWAMSDSMLIDEHSAPDIHAIGYNIETGNYWDEINITAGTDYESSAYFPTMAPIVKDNGDSYEIHVVFALSGGTDLDPPQYYYIKGMTFIDEDSCSLAPINVTASDTVNFCHGDSVILSAMHDGSELQWMRNGSSIPDATDDNYTVTKKGNYYCVVSNSCGVSNTSNAIYITVYKLPIVSVSADGPTAFCPGDSVTLSVTINSGQTYQWFMDSLEISGATDTSYVATVSGNYKCLVTNDTTGCSHLSEGITVTSSCITDDEIDLSISPNPAHDKFYLKISEELKTESTIKILSLSGNSVWEKKLPPFTQSIIIDLEDMKPGIYLLELQSDDKIISQKIIKG